MRAPVLFRIALGLIAAASRLVPVDARRDWRREWEAEVWHRRSRLEPGSEGVREGLDLVRRAAGAFVHAAWLRGRRWRPELVLQDARYALRTYSRSPAFTVAAVLTLGLGIAANVAVFSTVNAAFLRPYAYGGAERLAVVVNTDVERPGQPLPLAYPDVEAMRASGVFSHVMAWDWEPFNLRLEDQTLWVGGGRVGASVLPALGLDPVLGRGFLPEEDEPGAAPVVILSEGLWRSAFGADPGVLGRTVALDGVPHQVVGVAPSTLDIPEGARLWVPLGPTASSTTRRSHWLQAMARLADDVTWESASARLDALADRLAEAHPDTNEGRGLAIESVREARTGPLRPAMGTLLVAVGLLLLIVCANLANLMLARGAARRGELGVRIAMGASRWRLLRQLVTESLLLAGAGWVVGLLVGAWLAGLRLVPDTPSWLAGGVDGRVVLYATALAGLATLLFGLAPAVQATVVDVGRALTGTARGGIGRGRVRDALVLAEVALSVMLLLAAGLFLRSFRELTAVDPGFATRNRIVATLQLPSSRYGDDEALTRFARTLEDRVAELPGVQAAGLVTRFPLAGGYNSVEWWDGGQPASAHETNPQALLTSVSPGYVKAMGIELRSGRGFSEHDDASAPDVVLVNETFAREHFGGEAVGHRISFQYPARFAEIVGVVAPTKQTSLNEGPRYQIFAPLAQRPTSRLSLVVQAPGEPAAMAGTLRAVVRDLDPDLAVSTVRTVDQVVAAAVWQWRILAQMFWVFSSFAVLLAALGIYGVVSYAVARRTREIGVRMALGARGRDVAALVTSRVGRIVVLGLALGLAGGLGAGQLVKSMLFGVDPADPATLLAVTLGFGAVAAIAAAVPARRAARIDPGRTLRQE